MLSQRVARAPQRVVAEGEGEEDAASHVGALLAPVAEDEAAAEVLPRHSGAPCSECALRERGSDPDCEPPTGLDRLHGRAKRPARGARGPMARDEVRTHTQRTHS